MDSFAENIDIEVDGDRYEDEKMIWLEIFEEEKAERKNVLVQLFAELEIR